MQNTNPTNSIKVSLLQRPSLIGLFLVVLLCSFGVAAIAGERPDYRLATLTGSVVRVFDGDTIRIDTGAQAGSRIGEVIIQRFERVRYLGINSPELSSPPEYYAGAARRTNRRLVSRRIVRLEIVPGNERDSYGRLLAYVYMERASQWILVNAELVRLGAADVYFLNESERYYEYFRQMRIAAIAARIGIWSEYPGELTIADLERDPVKYILEAVTIRFTITRVHQDRTGVYIYGESRPQFNFRVFIPYARLSLFAEQGITPAGWQAGTTMAISGILTWTDGLIITLEDSLQIHELSG